MCVDPCDTAVYTSADPQTFAEKLPVYEKDYKALGKSGLKPILGAPVNGMGPWSRCVHCILTVSPSAFSTPAPEPQLLSILLLVI